MPADNCQRNSQRFNVVHVCTHTNSWRRFNNREDMVACLYSYKHTKGAQSDLQPIGIF